MTKSGGNMGFSTSLPLLGNIVELEAPEASWATARHFREYQRAMVNSFTANCDLISCWLELDDPSPCLTHIMKALDIVCSRFLLGQLEDKSVSQQRCNDSTWCLVQLGIANLKMRFTEPTRQCF